MSKAESQAKWRAAHPERARELVRQVAARWKAEHPDDPRSYWRKWRDEHPESVKATRTALIQERSAARKLSPEPFRIRDRDSRQPWLGMPEKVMHAVFAAENPTAICFDEARPDFYVPEMGFVEIKRALTFKMYSWRAQSEFFPGLYFLYTSKQSRSIDEQVAKWPRPLTVIVYEALSGEELQRRTFT